MKHQILCWYWLKSSEFQRNSNCWRIFRCHLLLWQYSDRTILLHFVLYIVSFKLSGRNIVREADGNVKFFNNYIRNFAHKRSWLSLFLHSRLTEMLKYVDWVWNLIQLGQTVIWHYWYTLYRYSCVRMIPPLQIRWDSWRQP